MSKWTPGMPSPNPKGRPKGIVDRRARIAKAFLDKGDEIAQVVIKQALNGDMQAANIVLSRLQPVLKARAERVEFALDPSAPLTQQAQQVLSAVAAGKIDPETGRIVIDSIGAFAKLREVEELEQRLQVIEQRVGVETLEAPDRAALPAPCGNDEE